MNFSDFFGVQSRDPDKKKASTAIIYACLTMAMAYDRSVGRSAEPNGVVRLQYHP